MSTGRAIVHPALCWPGRAMVGKWSVSGYVSPPRPLRRGLGGCLPTALPTVPARRAHLPTVGVHGALTLASLPSIMRKRGNPWPPPARAESSGT